MSLAIRLQSASSDFQKLQASMAETVDVRQKLEAQLSENELVKKVGKRTVLRVETKTWSIPGTRNCYARKYRLQADRVRSCQTRSNGREKYRRDSLRIY